MIEQEFAAGHLFFLPGDPGDRAFLIQHGQVELLAGPLESPVPVALFGPGDVFGEMALIEERPRTLAARALTACSISTLTRDEFERELIHNPVRARLYLRSLFERLRSLSAKLSEPTGTQAAPVESASSAAGVSPVDFSPALGASSTWVAIIHPLTRKAAETLPNEGLYVSRFPLRIGRAAAAHEPEPLDLNDLWLLDEKPYNISRNHCEIDADKEGLLVRDRGSHLGCLVNDLWIGGHSGLTAAGLEPGENVLIVGSRMSPYQFRVTAMKEAT